MLGMNGGLIAGCDTRTADLGDFFYLDTRGVLPFAQWVEGSLRPLGFRHRLDATTWLR